MARLQKKKPAVEKKKKKREQENFSDSLVSVSKSATTANPVKSRPGKKAAETVNEEPGTVQRAMDFLREVKVELKKVTWPSRKQTTGTTIVVIIFVFIVAAFLGLFDFSLSKLVQVVLT